MSTRSLLLRRRLPRAARTSLWLSLASSSSTIWTTVRLLGQLRVFLPDLPCCSEQVERLRCVARVSLCAAEARGEGVVLGTEFIVRPPNVMAEIHPSIHIQWLCQVSFLLHNGKVSARPLQLAVRAIQSGVCNFAFRLHGSRPPPRVQS